MATISEILLQNQKNAATDYTPLIEANPYAANTLADAATKAGQIGAGYLQQGIGSVQQGGAAATNVRSPYTQAGESALSKALDLTGVSGANSADVLAQTIQSPAYRLNFNEQMDALDRSAASKGKLYSGQQLKAVQDRASQLASTEYQNNLNNTMALLQQATPFAQQQATQQYTQGGDIAGLLGKQGEVLGESELARANALAQGLLGTASAQVAQSGSGVGGATLTPDRDLYVGGTTDSWAGGATPDSGIIDRTVGTPTVSGGGSKPVSGGGTKSGSGGGSTTTGSTSGTTNQLGTAATGATSGVASALAGTAMDPSSFNQTGSGTSSSSNLTDPLSSNFGQTPVSSSINQVLGNTSPVSPENAEQYQKMQTLGIAEPSIHALQSWGVSVQNYGGTDFYDVPASAREHFGGSWGLIPVDESPITAGSNEGDFNYNTPLDPIAPQTDSSYWGG